MQLLGKQTLQRVCGARTSPWICSMIRTNTGRQKPSVLFHYFLSCQWILEKPFQNEPVQVVLGALSSIRSLSRCTQTGSTWSMVRLTRCKLIFWRELSAFSACKKPLDSSRKQKASTFFWFLPAHLHFGWPFSICSAAFSPVSLKKES